jgi:hypothetical protein
MAVLNRKFEAIISSDWSECLSPSGPFDFIAFAYPELKPKLEHIFNQYTGNIITLGTAARQIEKLIPAPVSEKQMDAYLAESFTTYAGVPELITWCAENNILFMINTTGMIGYFQRVFFQRRLPGIQVLSANPMLRYPGQNSDPAFVLDLLEIQDKAKNTQTVVDRLKIPYEKIIIMGDSGGDGPHFQWGAQQGAFLIGSMTKVSLSSHCEKNDIVINLKFGLDYSLTEERDPQKEMRIDFMQLATVFEEVLG